MLKLFAGGFPFRLARPLLLLDLLLHALDGLEILDGLYVEL